MTQEIITYIIVFSACLYAVFSAVKLFLPKKKNIEHNCSSACSGCDLKNKTSKHFMVS